MDSKLLFSLGRETSDVNIRCCVFQGVPLIGTPPSNAGGSHVIMAESSPTDVHLTFSGELGTSGEAGYSWKWKDETEREMREGMSRTRV